MKTFIGIAIDDRGNIVFAFSHGWDYLPFSVYGLFDGISYTYVEGELVEVFCKSQLMEWVDD